MKKFAISIIACVAMAQCMYAATSPLTESLLEYEAITSAIGTDPNFQNVIPTVEFVVDIKRITKQVNVLGEVEYRILTVLPNAHVSESHTHTIKYIATLNVASNPGIGPNIVTVVSIVPAPVHHHHH